MKNIKLLIFDFDFTLADSMEAMLRVRQDLEKNHGLKMDNHTEKEIWGSNISTNAKWLKEWNYSDLSVDKIGKLIVKYVNKYYPALKVIYPEIFKEWMKKGKKFCIVTSCSDKVLKKTMQNKANKDIKFELIIQSDKDKGKEKCIRECLEKLKTKPDESIYIGDHINDILAAQNAGVFSCGITTGFYNKTELSKLKPDILISDLKELTNYI